MHNLMTTEKKFYLAQNVPNPFSAQTRIDFSTARAGRVRLAVQNKDKEVMTVLIDKVLPAGNHNVVWDMTTDDGQHVASGRYHYRLEAEGYVAIRTLTFKK